MREDIRKCIEAVEESTKNHNKLLVNVCFSYNSVYEIDRAVKEAVAEGQGHPTLQSLMYSIALI